MPGGIIDRDAVKANIPVLTAAINLFGFRVGVSLSVLHVKALYDLMTIPCPGVFCFSVNACIQIHSVHTACV